MGERTPAVIRPLERSDWPAWWTLWQAYLRFYGTSVGEDVADVTFARLLDPAERMGCALALRDGEAIGLVHWILHRTCWTIAESCYLQDLYVSEAARGTGAGRALIAHVVEVARTAGSARVYWMTQERNVTARRLYDGVAHLSDFVQYRIPLT